MAQENEITLTDAYLADLLRYYEEEFEGEGLFGRLAELATDARIKANMLDFVKLEIHTHTAGKSLIEQYQLQPRSREELLRRGAAEAELWADKSWRELMEIMVNEFPRFCDEFSETLRITPLEDQPYMQQLLDHEVAMIDFAKLELEGRQEESSLVLSKYFQKWPSR